MIANNRLHMSSLIDDRMKRSRVKADRTDGRKDSDSSRVKTHVIEAMLSEDTSAENTETFVTDLFKRLGGRRAPRLEVTPAANESVVTIKARAHAKDVDITAYLDTSNPRFWLLHSMSDSVALDALVNYWIDDLPELDPHGFPSACWTHFLKMASCGELGSNTATVGCIEETWSAKMRIFSQCECSPSTPLVCSQPCGGNKGNRM